MAKVSVKGQIREALSAERRAVKGLARDAGARSLPSGAKLSAVAADSFINFAQKLGIGADNALSTATYGYNPITRNRQLLEWIYRGSWLGGVAIDLMAADMTRAGIEFKTSVGPSVTEKLSHAATALDIWGKLCDTIAWGRLYGGAIAVALIDGQDPNTPLNLDTVGPDQFKGLLTLDRWQVAPSLGDLVSELGPRLGEPRYYQVQSNAPALRGVNVHYSRIMLRHEGIRLPYQQKLTENLWGISVLERLYDRMIAFDSATTGAAQLVYKAYLRTLKVEGMREIIAAGGAPLNGLMAYVDTMRRFQGQEGITLLDSKDEFESQQHSSFSGLSDALVQFGQQLSGALQIPLVRLFGQSPAGLNSTGESDLRMYYDNINKEQTATMFTGVTTIYELLARSEGIMLDDQFGLSFASLWQLKDTEKVDIADKVTKTVQGAYESGLISQRVAVQELRDTARKTNVFDNITDEDIERADAEVAPPGGEGLGDEPPTGNDIVDRMNAIKKEFGNAQPSTTPGADAYGARRRVRLR